MKTAMPTDPDRRAAILADPLLRRLYESARRLARLRVQIEQAQQLAELLDAARVRKGSEDGQRCPRCWMGGCG